MQKTNLFVAENREQIESWRQSLPHRLSERPRLGFVPTMGALHAGHLALIQRARQECENVAVSIFVNPLQFAPTEDLDRYPRTFEKDRQLCEEAGVDLIFHPSAEVIYPSGQESTTKVVPPPVLEQSLYGQYRPVFFTGVATVVNRLFNLIQPTVAYFGEKDYQQLIVIKRMVADLQMPVRIQGVPTVREVDGLAMSSRNVFLTPEQRAYAPAIARTLKHIAENAQARPDELPVLLREGADKLGALPDVDVKYLVACHADSLEIISRAASPMVLLIAAKFSDVWMIDTFVVRDDAEL